MRAPFTKEEAIAEEFFVCYLCKEDDCAHCRAGRSAPSV